MTIEPKGYLINLKDETNNKTFSIKLDDVQFEELLVILATGVNELKKDFDGYGGYIDRITKAKEFFNEFDVENVTLTFEK